MYLRIPTENNSPEFTLELKKTSHRSQSDLKDYIFLVVKSGDEYKLTTTIKKKHLTVELLNKSEFFMSGNFSSENSDYIDKVIASQSIPPKLKIL